MRAGVGMAIAESMAMRREAGRGRDRRARRQRTYRLAATIGAFTGSGVLGMVVTRAPVGAGAAAAAGCAGVAINPRALRTSISSFARVSLLSFKNWRAFSRPWPIRSPL